MEHLQNYPCEGGTILWPWFAPPSSLVASGSLARDEAEGLIEDPS